MSEVLSNPTKYHAKQTKDPLEPDYNNFKTVGILYLLGAAPILVSQAHGQKTYTLLRQPKMIEIKKGRMADAVNQVLHLLRELPNIFDKDKLLVKIENGIEIPILDPPAMSYFLSSVIQFYSIDGRSSAKEKVLKDPPDSMSKQLLSLGSERRLKPLKALITAPLVRLDGTLLSKQGYDKQTQLYLHREDLQRAQSIDSIQRTDVQEAFKVIWGPFKDFPFRSAIDRSVLLAAVFTAVQRGVIETSPAVGFDAPVQGSGKTLLAKTIGAICTGKTCPVWPDVGSSDEEIRKRILTLLKSGERIGVWDNILGVFDSKSLASFLTSESFQDRILGQSQQLSLPNRVFLLLTGNNLTLSGDMVRRVLKCTIDPQTDRPYAREFEVDPVQYSIANRIQIVEAVICIILAARKGNFKAPGNMASFEQWDSMVRQPIAWLSAEYPQFGLCDPIKAINDALDNDPAMLALSDFLAKVYKIWGDGSFNSKDLFSHIEMPESFPKSLKSEWLDLTGDRGNTRSIGRQLGYRENRIADGLKLVSGGIDRSAKVKLWKVVQVA